MMKDKIVVEYTSKLNLEYGDYVNPETDLKAGTDSRYYIETGVLLEIALFKKRVDKQIKEITGWDNE